MLQLIIFSLLTSVYCEQSSSASYAPHDKFGSYKSTVVGSSYSIRDKSDYSSYPGPPPSSESSSSSSYSSSGSSKQRSYGDSSSSKSYPKESRYSDYSSFAKDPPYGSRTYESPRSYDIPDSYDVPKSYESPKLYEMTKSYETSSYDSPKSYGTSYEPKEPSPYDRQLPFTPYYPHSKSSSSSPTYYSGKDIIYAYHPMKEYSPSDYQSNSPYSKDEDQKTFSFPVKASYSYDYPPVKYGSVLPADPPSHSYSTLSQPSYPSSSTSPPSSSSAYSSSSSYSSNLDSNVFPSTKYSSSGPSYSSSSYESRPYNPKSSYSPPSGTAYSSTSFSSGPSYSSSQSESNDYSRNYPASSYGYAAPRPSKLSSKYIDKASSYKPSYKQYKTESYTPNRGSYSKSYSLSEYDYGYPSSHENSDYSTSSSYPSQNDKYASYGPSPESDEIKSSSFLGSYKPSIRRYE